MGYAPRLVAVFLASGLWASLPHPSRSRHCTAPKVLLPDTASWDIKDKGGLRPSPGCQHNALISRRASPLRSHRYAAA